MANVPYETPPTSRLTVSSLLSPPEMKRSESFNSNYGPANLRTPMTSFSSEQSQPSSTTKPGWFPHAMPSNRDAFLSPPISPYEQQPQKENIDCNVEAGVRDPQLFVPGDPPASIAADYPLFPPEPTARNDVSEAIQQHMKSQEYAKLETKPTRDEYVLFASTVFTQWKQNPRAWFEREKKFNEMYYGKKPSQVQKRPALKRLAPAPSSGVRKPKMVLPRVQRNPRPAKHTPQSRVYDSFETSPQLFETPKPARQPTTRDDTDYKALPEYSPPTQGLHSKSLKADWKGQMLDLSNDPDRHMLHEAEVNLAATLRLSCATYLCSKRRIFMARIDALKIGKEFRKTDAQQACKIDVNKASKLWSAYDRQGWFNPEFFRQYLKA